MTVSYTHLDVYKRQLLDDPAALDQTFFANVDGECLQNLYRVRCGDDLSLIHI